MANRKRVKSAKKGKKTNQQPQSQQQVAREKTTTRKRKSKMPKQPTQWQGVNGVTYSNESDFMKLVLDPCAGPLEVSPFGAVENAYVWRMNYRSTFNSNASGNIMAMLYPSGVYNGFGSNSANLPQSIQVWNGSGLVDTVAGNATAAYPVPGLVALETLAQQLRVTAGCVKIKYIGPANSACGELYAWEGQGDEIVGAVASTQMVSSGRTPSDYAVNGQTFPITAGAEAMLNYSKCPPGQLGYGDPTIPQTGSYCPIAVVGVSGGPPSTAYVVEATLIVEWIPKLTQGIPAPNAKLTHPGAAERVANAIKLVAPLLVKAADLPTMGYASMFNKALKFGQSVYKLM